MLHVVHFAATGVAKTGVESGRTASVSHPHARVVYMRAWWTAPVNISTIRFNPAAWLTPLETPKELGTTAACETSQPTVLSNLSAFPPVERDPRLARLASSRPSRNPSLFAAALGNEIACFRTDALICRWIRGSELSRTAKVNIRGTRDTPRRGFVK